MAPVGTATAPEFSKVAPKKGFKKPQENENGLEDGRVKDQNGPPVNFKDPEMAPKWPRDGRKMVQNGSQ